jgi:Cft2 family RNA processing exonuclease
LYGTGKHEPLCSVLKIDEVTFLLDCGWNDTFDEAIVAPLRG